MENVNRTSTTEDAFESKFVVDKHVTIALASDITNRSIFRKVNYQFMEGRRDFIGGSLSAVNRLIAGEEMAYYMPEIIGINQTHPEFLERVKLYFNNITVPVDDKGLELNASFTYKNEKVAKQVANEEARIEAAFEESANKADLIEFKKALDAKVEALHQLESKKYTVGTPVNRAQYILYRYCLLYASVAKDSFLVPSNQNYRFYLKDANREKARNEKLFKQKMAALKEYMNLYSGDNTDKFNQVFAVISKREGWFDTYMLSDTEKQAKLRTYSEEQPNKFLKIATDKNLASTYLIETLIETGDLIRSEYSQNIAMPDGRLIGANLQEAIVWLQDPANAGYVSSFKKKLSL